jgi:hypothetical protein
VHAVEPSQPVSVGQLSRRSAQGIGRVERHETRPLLFEFALR